MKKQALKDLLLIGRAIAANLAAQYIPSLYFRQADLTGRGLNTGETGSQIADYAWHCFREYFERLGVDVPENFLAGKTVLEYGPGDFPGVALLMLAHGARKAICADRFALLKLNETNLKALQSLLARCTFEQAERLRACLVDPSNPAAGLKADRLSYCVSKDGLSGLSDSIDFVFSRAVLEHVNDLDATVRDMVDSLHDGGTSLHQVDLRSHGNHRQHPLDFLEWSPRLWRWMHSAKGSPNRHRIDAYRSRLESAAVDSLLIEPTLRLTAEEVRVVRPVLAPEFRSLSDDELACLGMWIHFRRRPRQGQARPMPLRAAA